MTPDTPETMAPASARTSSPETARDLATVADPDWLWTLNTVPELAARLMEVAESAGFTGATLSVIDGTGAKPRFRRIVEEGDRLPAPEPALEPVRELFLKAIERSTVPLRWCAGTDRDCRPVLLPPQVLRDCERVATGKPGLCIPVRSGGRRAGGVFFIGHSCMSLTEADVLALRVFALCWFVRLSQIAGITGGHLTARERQCLQFASDGLTSEAIARRLDLSKHTVDHHLVSATAKLKASNRAHAVAESLRLGIVV